MPTRPTHSVLLASLVLTLAACGGTAATAPPTTSPTGTPQPTPTSVPGDPGNGSSGSGGGSGGTITNPGSGGGSDGNAGSGVIGIPFPGGGGDPNQDPLFGQATYLTPGTDLQNQHPVNVQLVRALQKDDGSVIADLRWWSGVAPCSQLDHVEITKDDAAHTISFIVIEGAGKGEVACIDIAQLSATTVDLGTLAVGDWKLAAQGDAPTITLEVH
ncbi:MAG TPA: hypothetical protein VHL56_10640 [Candidatus Limnocylindrales bacterium]|jgi:hypothetical protein|nr:hypothetical protein [Candidatus Limnocylindrales bacterium]